MRPVRPEDINAKCRARAEELGVDPVQYRRWERGERVPEVNDAIDREAYEAERSEGEK